MVSLHINQFSGAQSRRKLCWWFSSITAALRGYICRPCVLLRFPDSKSMIQGIRSNDRVSYCVCDARMPALQVDWDKEVSLLIFTVEFWNDWIS